MTNTLETIKQAEADADKAVSEAKKSIEDKVAQADEIGSKNVTAAESQVSPQIEEAITEAKSKIQAIKAQKERELDNQLKALENIDKKLIDQAANTVIKEITK